MGYYTTFNLNITPLSELLPKAKVSLDGIIEEVENGLTQDQLLDKLKLLEKGEDEDIDSEYLIAQLRKQSQGAQYCLNEDGGCEESGKWYEYDDDLKSFSKKYPDWLFTLEGEGEESGDIWKAYFVNGKCQKATARIIIDDFDPLKLE